MKRSISKVCIVLGIVAHILPCYALTKEEVIARLKGTKLTNLGTRINADVDAARKTAVVTTFAKPEAQDKDFKIDAVFIAKEVMDLDKEAVVKVRVLFYDQNDLKRYSQVTVRVGDIAGFDSGRLKNETLLDSLDVEKFDASAASNQQTAGVPQAAGVSAKSSAPSAIDQSRLDKAQQAIAELRKQNVGVSAYKKLYDEAVALSQDSARAPEALEKFSQLEDALQEQRQKMQAKTAANVNSNGQTTASLTPKVQAAVDGIVETRNKAFAALPDLMAHPETARQSFGEMASQFAQQMQQMHGMAESYFGHWKASGEAFKHERMELYYYYVQMENQHYKMDSYWYQYRQIEAMVAKFEQVERIYDDAVSKRDTKESGLRAAQLRVMSTQILNKIDLAKQAAGIQPHEHGEHGHGWGEHRWAEHP